MYNYIRNIKNEKIFTPSNILRILGMLIRKPLVGPLKVNIDITDKCDMHCIMCWYHSSYLKKENSERDNFFMPVERIKSLAKELKTIKTKIIMLCGEGEPLLHPRLEEIMEIMRANSLEVEIMTNAYYLDKKRVDYFSKVGLKKIIVSMHAPDFETFSKIRPLKTKEDFEIIMDNLLYLKSIRSPKNNPQFFMINVISHLNYPAVSGMVKLAEDLKVDKMIFKPVVLNSELPGELKLQPDIIIPVINKLREHSLHISIPNNIRDFIATLYSLTKKSEDCFHPKRCYIPFIQSVINVDGKILGCVYAKSPPLGDILKDKFTDIWFGKRYNEFRKSYFCPQQCIGKAVYPLLI